MIGVIGEMERFGGFRVFMYYPNLEEKESLSLCSHILRELAKKDKVIGFRLYVEKSNTLAQRGYTSPNVWTQVLGYLYPGYSPKTNDWGGGRYGIFKCPKSPREWTDGDGINYIDYGVNNIWRSYWQNGWLPDPIKRDKIKKVIILNSDTPKFRDNPTFQLD